MIDSVLDHREVGHYPLSIPTSLALESINGIHPDYPMVGGRAPIHGVSALWVNCSTLFRNMWNSLKSGDSRGIHAAEFVTVLQEEMQVIRSVIADNNPKVKVVFYISSYWGLETKYPHAVIRKDNTDYQKIYTSIHNEAIQSLIDACKDTDPIVGYKLKIEPKDHQPKALILTHYAFDLLAAKHFDDLQLVESNTGKIKSKSLFYTKYSNSKSLPAMPFREDFLQILGDSQHFRPMAPQYRKILVGLAESYGWTALTTTDKIRNDVKKVDNPYARAMILDIMV